LNVQIKVIEVLVPEKYQALFNSSISVKAKQMQAVIGKVEHLSSACRGSIAHRV
jgi:hypothetical protein